MNSDISVAATLLTIIQKNIKVRVSWLINGCKGTVEERIIKEEKLVNAGFQTSMDPCVKRNCLTKSIIWYKTSSSRTFFRRSMRSGCSLYYLLICQSLLGVERRGKELLCDMERQRMVLFKYISRTYKISLCYCTQFCIFVLVKLQYFFCFHMILSVWMRNVSNFFSILEGKVENKQENFEHSYKF